MESERRRNSKNNEIMTRKIFLFSITYLLCFVQTYSWQLKQDFNFGSFGYKQAETSLRFPVSERVFAGVKYSAYSLTSNDDYISCLTFPYNAFGDSTAFTIEPFLYLPGNGFDSVAQGVYIKNIFQIYRNPEKDTWGQFTLNLGMLFQKVRVYSGSFYNEKEIPEFTYGFSYSHDFYKQFALAVSATGFCYQTDAGKSHRALVDQRKIAVINTGRVLTEFPTISLAAEFSRTYETGHNSKLILGYDYLEFKHNFSPIHSVSAGFEMNISAKTAFSFMYNWIAQSTKGKKNYYHFSMAREF